MNNFGGMPFKDRKPYEGMGIINFEQTSNI